MARSSVLVAIYRALMTEARTLRKDGVLLPCRRPVSRDEWGKGGFETTTGDGYHLDCLSSLLPGVTEAPESGIFSGEDLAHTVRHHFRHGMKGDVISPSGGGADIAVDHALNALKVLGDQLHLARCSSVAETDGLRVEATSTYLPNNSSPNHNRYGHAYRIRIENVSHDGPVKLLGRHWLILDTEGKVAEVAKGSPGVVGYYPELRPGMCFQYASGLEIRTPKGAMSGSFQMREGGEEEEGESPPGGGGEFDVEVPPFKLVAHGRGVPTGSTSLSGDESLGPSPLGP